MVTLICIWDAPLAKLWLRGQWEFLLYKPLYIGHALRRRRRSRPSRAIQLYSAIHHTAIHRYTLYDLYNTPLASTHTTRNDTATV